MLYNILFVISKCIKPFFKNKLLDIITPIEDIIISNFIFFSISFMSYKYNNNSLNNINNKLNNNYFNMFMYLMFTGFEIYLNNLLLMNDNVIESKILQKSLYIMMMPFFGYALFKKNKKNTLIGCFIILIGILIIN